jgi:hypothetical protein
MVGTRRSSHRDRRTATGRIVHAMSTTDPRASATPGPFLMIDTAAGVVEVWALGGDRFSIRTPGGEREVTGFHTARDEAHRLARE